MPSSVQNSTEQYFRSTILLALTFTPCFSAHRYYYILDLFSPGFPSVRGGLRSYPVGKSWLTSNKQENPSISYHELPLPGKTK
jgi:hypothetical protein